MTAGFNYLNCQCVHITKEMTVLEVTNKFQYHI
jgi:hypothetical protein